MRKQMWNSVVLDEYKSNHNQGEKCKGKKSHLRFICSSYFYGVEAILNGLHVSFWYLPCAFVSNSAMLNIKPVGNTPKHIGN